MRSKLYVLTEDGEFKKVEGIKVEYDSDFGGNSNQTSQEELLTIETLSKLIDRSKPSIYSLVHHRKIPHIKKSKRLYFEKSKILEWIKSGTVATTSDIEAKANEYLSKNRL